MSSNDAASSDPSLFNDWLSMEGLEQSCAEWQAIEACQPATHKHTENDNQLCNSADFNSSNVFSAGADWQAYVPPEQPFALDHASRMDHWDMESAPSHAPPPVAFSGEDLPDFAFQAFSSNNETSLQELNQPSSQPQTSTIIHIDPTINTYVASPYTGSVLGPTISRSQNARSLSINASSLPRPPITSTHATWDAGATANKRQRLAAPRHKTTSTKVTCMFCQQGGVKCSGVVTFDDICEHCQESYGDASSHYCVRASFFEIIKEGSVNPRLALYELSFAQVEATGTDRLSVTFEAIKMIDQNYLNIVFKPPKYSMGCRINTTVLLQITKAAFSILDNGLPKYPFLNQERVISAIEAKLSLDETGDFICLIMDPQLEQNMSFLEKVLRFYRTMDLLEHPFGQHFAADSETTNEEVINDTRTITYIKYIASRYYELLLYWQLQKFCNSKGLGVEKSKTNGLVRLIFEVAMQCSTSQPCAMLTTLKNATDCSRQVHNRRIQVRRILYAFLYTIQHKINPETKVYRNFDKSLALLSQLFRNAFIAPQQFNREYILFEASERAAYLDKCVVQSYLRRVPYELSSSGNVNANFLKLAGFMLHSYIKDLYWTIAVRFPYCGLSKQVRRKILLGRLFPCLSAADFSLILCAGNPHMLSHHIKTQSVYRRMCIAFFHDFEAWKAVTGLTSRDYVDAIVTTPVKVSAATVRKEPLYRALHRGRRWSDLVDLLGTAILYVGGPVKDSILPLDVLCIVEEADDNYFTLAKKLLRAGFWWLQKECKQMIAIVDELQGDVFPRTKKHGELLQSKIAEIFYPHAVSSAILGGLRPAFESQSPHSLVLEILAKKPKPESEAEALRDLLCCVIGIEKELRTQTGNSVELCPAALSRILETALGIAVHEYPAFKRPVFTSYINRILEAARGSILS